MSNTVTVEIQDTTYTLKIYLPWQEMQRIEEKAFRFFVNGKALSAGDDIGELEELEMRLNTAQHNMARLRARLLDIKRRDITKLQPPHVALLIERIVELEADEQAEVEALKDENPTEKN